MRPMTDSSSVMRSRLPAWVLPTAVYLLLAIYRPRASAAPLPAPA
jgi:hypothetical protein